MDWLEPGDIVPGPGVSVVVAYEDLDSGHRVKEVLANLAKALDSKVEIKITMWKFNLLDIESMHQIALDDALAADIVLVATGEQGELTAGVRQWIKQWLDEREDRPYALVSLSGKDSEAGEGTFSPARYLKATAQQNGVDFFCEQSHWREDHFQCALGVIQQWESEPKQGPRSAPGRNGHGDACLPQDKADLDWMAPPDRF